MNGRHHAADQCAHAAQVGRAGRTSQSSYCHCFVLDSDFVKLRSLLHSDSLDASAVHSFLQHVFAQPELQPDDRQQPEACQQQQGWFRLLVLARLAADCDMKEAVLETLLSYMEVDRCSCTPAVLRKPGMLCQACRLSDRLMHGGAGSDKQAASCAWSSSAFLPSPKLVCIWMSRLPAC